MDEQNEQLAKAAIRDLQLETSLLQIALVHLAARIANEAPDPGNWLRDFADELHASIDGVMPPTETHSVLMVEMLRGRLDRRIHGVQTRLAKAAA